MQSIWISCDGLTAFFSCTRSLIETHSSKLRGFCINSQRWKFLLTIQRWLLVTNVIWKIIGKLCLHTTRLLFQSDHTCVFIYHFAESWKLKKLKVFAVYTTLNMQKFRQQTDSQILILHFNCYWENLEHRQFREIYQFGERSVLIVWAKHLEIFSAKTTKMTEKGRLWAYENYS